MHATVIQMAVTSLQLSKKKKKKSTFAMGIVNCGPWICGHAVDNELGMNVQ